MTFKRSLLSFCVLSLISPLALADKSIEVITVTTKPQQRDTTLTQVEASITAPDVSDWLLSVPGANANKNGAISGVAQYRGYYGDQVAVLIDGVKQIGAGPNAMDAPLSYASPLLIDSIDVYRGIAPVSSALDTLGGAVKVKQKRAIELENGEVLGAATGTYLTNNQGINLSGVVGIGQDRFALSSYVSVQQADHYEDGKGRELRSSEIDRLQYGLDLGYRLNTGHVSLMWQKTDTQPTGTVALPMDIDYVDSDRIKLDLNTEIAGLEVNAYLAYHQAEHGMDNYSQRSNANMTKFRYNTTDVDNISYYAATQWGDWLMGVEGYESDHGSRITNPNNAMFEIINFNQVEDNRHSAFIEWQQQASVFSQTVGIRVKQNEADAGEVLSSMAMMNPMVKKLQDNFNGAKRDVTDTTLDIAYTGRFHHSDALSSEFGFGFKQRAASYQQRYLWLPMQATGGLADGKTYVGNINLDPETAYQFNLGLNYQKGSISIAPQVFYHDITDYIQGTPSENMAVKMVAGMMGDATPLQFSNIDAHLYGADINLAWQINDSWQLTSVASYISGEREDVKDHLYRIAPLNMRTSLHYFNHDWHSQLTLSAYKKQTKVSEINNEKVSPGYATLDWQVDYDVSNQLRINFGINNLLDKFYRPHLNGINRANGSDVTKGEAVPELGRNLFVGFNYSL